MANEVATKASASLALFGDDAKGFDNMTQDDLALPFVRILGQLSPQVTMGDSKYIEAAKPGMIYNTVTSELYDGKKGIKVIPCYYKKDYPEWSDRGDGPGAPVAVHLPNSPVIATGKRDGSKIRLPNGNYLENTASYFVLTDDLQTALISMKSTQLKVSRSWNSMMNSIKLKGKNGLFVPAAYSHVYNLKTVQQSNDKGTWFGWSVEKVGPVQDKDTYEAAKAFASTVATGAVEAKHGASETTSDTSKGKDEVPF